MAICDACQQEMTAAETMGCVAEPITFPDGTELAPTPLPHRNPVSDALTAGAPMGAPITAIVIRSAARPSGNS
jgi:hypothetical protein